MRSKAEALLAARVASIPRQYAQASRSNGGGSDKSPFPLEPGSILRSSLDFFPRLMICTHLDIRHTYSLASSMHALDHQNHLESAITLLAQLGGRRSAARSCQSIGIVHIAGIPDKWFCARGRRHGRRNHDGRVVEQLQ